MSSSERVVLVTGGSGGLGEAVARRFLADNYKVAIADLQNSKGSALADELGDTAIFVPCDVRSESDIEHAFEATVAKFGTCHAAVLAAGIVFHHHTIPLTDVTAEEFDETHNINLRGSFLCVKHAARTFKKLNIEGAIVTVASIGGMRGHAAVDAAYQISKFGVIGLTQMAAAKLIHDKIRVNCVSPTSCNTPMIAAIMADAPPEIAEATKARMPTLCPLRQELTDPKNVAAIVAFLCSEAARELTGINVPVDQGWSAGANAAVPPPEPTGA